MKTILKICLLTALFFMVATTVQAQGAFDSDLKSDFDSYLNIVADAPGFETNIDENAAGVITNLIAFVISLVGIIFLILVIWSGIQWMSSGGNEEKITEARKRMIRASIGLAITLGAFVISYTVYSFLSEQYLDNTGTDIGAPAGSQTTIACEGNGQVPDCSDRGTRIYCSNNNCVECINDSDCTSRNDMPADATYCHPTWNICLLPEGTKCIGINDTGLCLARNDCKWIVTGSGDGGTWATGQCVDELNSCPRCNENTPVCAQIAGQADPQCFECVNINNGPNIKGACNAFQLCSPNHTCFP